MSDFSSPLLPPGVSPGPNQPLFVISPDRETAPIDVIGLFVPLWRWRWWVVVIFFIMFGLGAAYLNYTGTSTVRRFEVLIDAGQASPATIKQTLEAIVIPKVLAEHTMPGSAMTVQRSMIEVEVLDTNASGAGSLVAIAFEVPPILADLGDRLAGAMSSEVETLFEDNNLRDSAAVAQAAAQATRQVARLEAGTLSAGARKSLQLDLSSAQSKQLEIQSGDTFEAELNAATVAVSAAAEQLERMRSGQARETQRNVLSDTLSGLKQQEQALVGGESHAVAMLTLESNTLRLEQELAKILDATAIQGRQQILQASVDATADEAANLEAAINRLNSRLDGLTQLEDFAIDERSSINAAIAVVNSRIETISSNAEETVPPVLTQLLHALQQQRVSLISELDDQKRLITIGLPEQRSRILKEIDQRISSLSATKHTLHVNQAALADFSLTIHQEKAGLEMRRDKALADQKLLESGHADALATAARKVVYAEQTIEAFDRETERLVRQAESTHAQTVADLKALRHRIAFEVERGASNVSIAEADLAAFDLNLAAEIAVAMDLVESTRHEAAAYQPTAVAASIDLPVAYRPSMLNYAAVCVASGLLAIAIAYVLEGLLLARLRIQRPAN